MTSPPERVYVPGQIVVVTAGEYSGYGITGAYRALKAFSESEAVTVIEERFGQRSHVNINDLIARGLIEEVSWNELWSLD